MIKQKDHKYSPHPFFFSSFIYAPPPATNSLNFVIDFWEEGHVCSLQQTRMHICGEPFEAP